MTWNDKNYTAIVGEYSVLNDKPESVALAVWALRENANMTPEDWRTLSKETGVKVAGRAVGSAREILGLAPKTKKARPKAGKGPGRPRGPGRPKGSGFPKSSGRKAAPTDIAGSIDDLVGTIRTLQEERDAAVAALAKVRAIVDSL